MQKHTVFSSDWQGGQHYYFPAASKSVPGCWLMKVKNSLKNAMQQIAKQKAHTVRDEAKPLLIDQQLSLQPI